MGRGSWRSAAGLLAALLAPSSAFGQATVTGSVSALADYLPNVPVPGSPDRADAVSELRLRAIADARIDAKPWLRFRFAGVADGLLADRRDPLRAGAVDALEAWIELAGAHGDLRAGMSRLTWGRLDEIQPTDVVNPIDVSRYLLEGRSEARIAVPLVRGRLLLLNDRLTIEGVIVPVFRPGRFDRLDEDSSPFTLFNDIPPPACIALVGVVCPERWTFERQEPAAGRLQGGARAGVTTGRLDWSLSVWRGFMPFALLDGAVPGAAPALRLSHPRYTMFGGDFETVIGKWAIRGEAAFFPDRPVQVSNEARWFEADNFEGGVGLDRRAGDFTLFGTLLFRRANGFVRRPVEGFVPRPTFNVFYTRTSDNVVSFAAGFSRTFNRDRVETRLFSLVNPEDRAAFVRGVIAWKPADDLAIESSIGWFFGDGGDVVTRFGDRDFAGVKLKYYFGSR